MGLISTVLYSWDSCLLTITKSLVGGCHFIYFVFFQYMHSESHSCNDIVQNRHPSPCDEASLHFLIALVLSGGKPPWDADPRFELGHAIQQASALPTELRCTMTELRGTLLSYCTLYPTELYTLHPIELRCTLTELRCTLLSYAAPIITLYQNVLQSAIIRQCWGRILKERMGSEKVTFQQNSRLFGP